MIRISDTYENTTEPSTEYPYGSAKNETTTGALDGTPLELAIYNDIIGMMQSIAVAGGVVPSNTADTVLAPQFLTAIFNLRYYAHVDHVAGTKVIGSDGVTYHCVTANGPTTTVQDPTTDTTAKYWVSEDVRAYEKSHPVGTYYDSNVDSSPEDFMGSGVGTYTRVEDRFRVSVGTTFPTAGATGGSTTHGHNDDFSIAGTELTSAQLPNQAKVGGDTGNAQQLVNGRSGTGDAHDHELEGSVTDATALPPYIAAYSWRRTA